MLKTVAVAVLSIFILFLIVQIYLFWQRGKVAEAQYKELSAELLKAKTDYGNLQSDFEYYSNPANLEKELRTRFNYRGAGEKLIIVVPAASTSATSSFHQ